MQTPSPAVLRSPPQNNVQCVSRDLAFSSFVLRCIQSVKLSRSPPDLSSSAETSLPSPRAISPGTLPDICVSFAISLPGVIISLAFRSLILVCSVFPSFILRSPSLFSSMRLSYVYISIIASIVILSLLSLLLLLSSLSHHNYYEYYCCLPAVTAGTTTAITTLITITNVSTKLLLLS